MPAPRSDRELVRGVLSGTRDDFAVLVDRYRRTAILTATAVLGRRDDAEDVAQDAFVRAYTQLSTCRDHDRFAAWLLTIVRRVALNQLRAQGRRATGPLPDDLAEAPGRRHDAVLADRERLMGALRGLSATEREVLLLVELEELPHAEVSRRTGVSVFMSRRHLSVARRKIRDYVRSSHVENS